MNFKKRYRIVRDTYSGYECQSWRWWFPVWLQMGGVNTFSTVEGAKAYIDSKALNRTVVDYHTPPRSQQMSEPKPVGWMKYFDGKIAFEKYNSFLPADAINLGWREIYTDDKLSIQQARIEALEAERRWIPERSIST